MKLLSIFMGNPPDKNIESKERRDFPQIKGYMIKKSESLKLRVGGRENKGNLGQMEWIPLRKLRICLADVEMIGST